MKNNKWIKPASDTGDTCPVFKKNFNAPGKIKTAKLAITAKGVYEATINGALVGDFFMAPGWTSYDKRHLYQEYDVTQMLKADNTIEVTVGRGWYSGRLGFGGGRTNIWGKDYGLIAQLEIVYENGEATTISTDHTWEYAKSPILFSDIYDGEIYDARITPGNWQPAGILDEPTNHLLPHDGEFVREFERLKPVKLITSPKGETILDFGQNLTGRLEFTVNANAGDEVKISHAEVLDKDGNFYTENLRSAKSLIEYTCKDGLQTYKPHFTFMGFRYIRLDKYPCEAKEKDFTAIVAHSDIKRTGYFNSSHPKLNRLFENIIWGQKGNFLDIPTDCPQRDEKLGWTGDAQVFVRAAAYNFDVQKFFKKWLRDLAADQFPDGAVPYVIPDVLSVPGGKRSGLSAAWGDAAVICPWQIYLTYGDKDILAEQYDSMTQWVEYIRNTGDNEFLWDSGEQLGDWLGLDATEGSYTGSSDKYFIATAFYAYSTSLLIKTAKVLGKDFWEYEKLYNGIVDAFYKTFTCKTQTEHALAIYFGLTDKQKAASDLAKMVIENGNKLTTGFVGTPYLLHALSENGYATVAYNLLLQEEMPSWLYQVDQGATTMWEHWDGIKENGEMWSANMNSFNHYAYGAVADWMYGVAAGIQVDEDKPGFEHIILKPVADKRLEFLEASIDTRYGRVWSKWTAEGDKFKYEFKVPTTATITIGGETWDVEKGVYSYIK